jgi:hypothetical protein
MACTACGAQANASCNCGVPYEVMLHKREATRQRVQAHRQRKREQHQQPSNALHDGEWTDAEILEETPPAEYRLTEKEHAESIVREVEREIAELQDQDLDLDLLRELILQQLTDSFKPAPA